MPERVLVSRVCFITGLPPRTVQLLASKGQIPGAAKLGSRWTFNEATVRGWVDQEVKRCQERTRITTSIAGAPSGMPVLKSAARSYEQAYTQMMAKRRAAAATAGSRK